MELKVCLENFPYNANVVIPAGCVSGFTARVNLEDSVGRKLYLQAVVTPNSGARIKVDFYNDIHYNLDGPLFPRLPFPLNIGS